MAYTVIGIAEMFWLSRHCRDVLAPFGIAEMFGPVRHRRDFFAPFGIAEMFLPRSASPRMFCGLAGRRWAVAACVEALEA